MSLSHYSHESRRAPREAVDCQSQIWGSTLAPSPALLVNISPHGCMVRSDQIVPIGESLTVDVPGVGNLRGVVMWSLGARIGIEFEIGLGLETYLGMLSMMKGPFAEQGPA
jgi:hypothetical protein